MNVYMRVFFLQFQCFVNLKFKIFIFLQLLTKVYNFFMLLELRVWVPSRKSLYNWCNFIISIYIPDAIIYLRLYVVLKCCKKGIGTTIITLWVVLLTTNQRSSSESCVCDCQLWEIDFVSILINSDFKKVKRSLILQSLLSSKEYREHYICQLLKSSGFSYSGKKKWHRRNKK